MNRTRTCPRCEGFLSLVEDVGDRYYSCIQCGFVADAPAVHVEAPV